MDLQYEVIIIGAGPAGMNAALYASRAGLKTLILEKSAPGGKLMRTAKIENWLGIKDIDGANLAFQMYEHCQEYGALYAYGDVENIIDKGQYKEVVCTDNVYQCKAVIVCTGREEKMMNLEDEEKYRGRGISYCAICDGALFKNKDICVVGGGNAALEESLYLSQFVKSIKILVRNQLRAEQMIIDKVMANPKIEILYNTQITKIIGKDGLVESVKIKNNKTNEEGILYISAIFPYIGQDPATNFLKHYDILDKHGYISVKENMSTNIEGIFAAGDVVVKEIRQVITAASDGAIAAQSAYNYIRK